MINLRFGSEYVVDSSKHRRTVKYFRVNHSDNIKGYIFKTRFKSNRHFLRTGEDLKEVTFINLLCIH